MNRFAILALFCVALIVSAKIQSQVISWADSHDGRADIMIELSQQVDMEALNAQAKSMDQIEQGRFVYATLKKNAEESQTNIRRFLNSYNIRFVDLWIQNTIAAYDVKLEVIQKLEKSNEISSIWLNGIVNPQIEEPVEPITVNDDKSDAVEWSIEQINAPKLWAKGHKGKGAVLAVSDTGVHFTHESLVSTYRGNKGNTFDHNYNWFDATTLNRTAPNDSNGHGSHCMSIAAGGYKGLKVGVAPESTWIACRPFSSSGRPADFIRCLQFFLAPHKLDGTGANPDLRPHVSSHSYFCDNCNMLRSIEALRAAGSLFVKSAGNRGPACSSITEPGFYKSVVAIGALAEKSDAIASFSSRGPTRDGLMKPDFSAPGQNINAAVPSSNSAYRKMSGTSMAAPNFNGAVGLIWAAVPRLARKIDETIEIFKKSSKGQTVSNTCSSNGSPNNVFGYGTIDVLKAYEIAVALYGDK